MKEDMITDVVIVGGGPAGLSAALVLGRARKRVVLFDAGPARNAAADHVNGFFTQDGTPPAEMRRIGRDQLVQYGTSVRDARVESITPEGQGFLVRTASEVVKARRVLLTVGMIDELPDLPGLRDHWGKSVFICPYCHAWEFQDRVFGVVAAQAAWVEHALFLKAWTRDLVMFTNAAFEVPLEVREKLERAKVRIDERRIVGLRGNQGALSAVMLEGGDEVACDALLMKPRQRQTQLVTSLGLALDEQGFVRVDEQRATSVPGIHAAGDLTTMFQGALVGAAEGAHAAYRMNLAMTMEMVAAGEL